MIGQYVIHAVRSKYDYKKHFISPPRSSPTVSQTRSQAILHNPTRPPPRRRREGEHDAEEGATSIGSLMRRREIYKHGLYVKHIASNKITRFGPPPTPAKIASSPDLQSKATAFVHRDLRALGWEDSSFSNSNRGRRDSSQDVISPEMQRPGIDLEFMTSYVMTLLKMIDPRRERGVRLLAEYLDPGVRDGEGRMKNAEHLAHGENQHISPFLMITNVCLRINFFPSFTLQISGSL